MQSNRCAPHKARNLARASCGAKGHAKIRVNCQQILQTSGSVGSPAGLASNKQWQSPRLAAFGANDRPCACRMSAAEQVSRSRIRLITDTWNSYRYARRSIKVTREVARKSAARITRRTLEPRMPLTGAAREFLDSQKVTACNRPARRQSCANAT